MTVSPKRTRHLLDGLVRAESPSGDEDGAASVLVDQLDDLGIEAWRDEVGNVHAARGPEDAPCILSLGHIDTVPGGPEPRWEDEVLHGRGTVDAKGPLAAHVMALAQLSEPEARVHLVAAVQEETDGAGARHLLEQTDPPEALLIAEPSGLTRVGLGYRGRMKLTASVEAAPRHPGHPTPTAPERLLQALDDLTEWTGNPDRVPGVERTTLRVLDLDTQPGDPSTGRAQLDLRYPRDPPSIEELERRVPAGVQLAVEDAVPGTRADPRNPVARSLRAGLHEANLEPEHVRKTGTSDWNVLAQEWTVPAAVYGPGDASLDHAPDERIALSEVVDASEVLTTALEQLGRQLAE